MEKPEQCAPRGSSYCVGCRNWVRICVSTGLIGRRDLGIETLPDPAKPCQKGSTAPHTSPDPDESRPRDGHRKYRPGSGPTRSQPSTHHHPYFSPWSRAHPDDNNTTAFVGIASPSTSTSMAAISNSGRRLRFVPKADAAVLSAKNAPPPPKRPETFVIFDRDNLDKPLAPWSDGQAESLYPPKADDHAPASIPERPTQCLADKYLRAFLSKHERLRLSMLWYYTRDIFDEGDFLCGLREKVLLAQEATGWEYVVLGLLDVNVYIRLATIGLPLSILPRGETICAHTVTQPPSSVFLLPDMMEDWRFRESPYVESGGLVAYAGVPLRLHHESGDAVGLGSLCVASATAQPPLTKSQQGTLAHLADWVVSSIIHCARARRQRERHRMTERLAQAQAQTDGATPEEPILRILRDTYPDAVIGLQSSKAAKIEVDGRDPISPSDLEDGLWEDIDYLDEFIENSNHLEFPCNRVVRIIAAPCDSISGQSLLVVGSKDMRLVFDDIDSWFVQTCAVMLSQTWQKRLLAEALVAKEKFLRGFSHQLRTPIHGILGSAELLAEELKQTNLRETADQVSKMLEAAPAAMSGQPSIYLDTIKMAGRDLISIVNSMITLNRWSDVAMKDRHYDVHTIDQLETELANEMLAAISGDTRYKASVFFKHHVPADYDNLRVDLSLLRDSVLPLILNAIHNTSEGVVVVTTSLRPDRKELVVDVEDTGCGIHPDDQQRIFEPYEKVGSHSTGAGLGLTLASKFAALLHGSVTLVSSGIGQGSHFRAEFREVHSVSSPVTSQQSASKLKNLPSRFHYKAPGFENPSLYTHFSGYLTEQGFAPSDGTEDCFTILDFVPGLEQRRAYFSQIPPEQVAFCLIPVMEAEFPLDGTPSNIVYVRGPFLTSTISSALEEADGLVVKIKPSLTHPIQRDEPSLTPATMDARLSKDKGIGSLVNLSRDMAQSIKIIPVSPSLAIGTSPATNTPQDSGIPVPIVATLRSTPRPTALLVDDNTVNLRIMQMYCKKRGLPFLCATDGAQAVELFSKHQSSSAAGQNAPIELILMDLQMPVCDGIDATKQIRILEDQNKWDRSVIAIVTGQDSPSDRLDAEGAGADDFYVKPVSIKLLDRAVQRYFPSFVPP
ncbi:hypothetical protein JX266_005872 [Neoarthrinium moseri]|nr:hypothetical protein JX266_005872 [Neoarthrinium moseri]